MQKSLIGRNYLRLSSLSKKQTIKKKKLTESEIIPPKEQANKLKTSKPKPPKNKGKTIQNKDIIIEIPVEPQVNL